MCVDRERAVRDILFGSILLPYKLSILSLPLSLLLLCCCILKYYYYYYTTIGPKPSSTITIFYWTYLLLNRIALHHYLGLHTHGIAAADQRHVLSSLWRHKFRGKRSKGSEGINERIISKHGRQTNQRGGGCHEKTVGERRCQTVLNL